MFNLCYSLSFPLSVVGAGVEICCWTFRLFIRPSFLDGRFRILLINYIMNWNEQPKVENKFKRKKKTNLYVLEWRGNLIELSKQYCSNYYFANHITICTTHTFTSIEMNVGTASAFEVFSKWNVENFVHGTRAKTHKISTMLSTADFFSFLSNLFFSYAVNGICGLISQKAIYKHKYTPCISCNLFVSIVGAV